MTTNPTAANGDAAIRLSEPHADGNAIREMTPNITQAFLHALIESTRDMVWSVDAKTLRLLTFNSALRDYLKSAFGVEIRNGMTLEDILPPERARVWHEFHRRVLNEGQFRVEFELFGGAGFLELAFSPIVQNGEVLGISVFGKDITERKKAAAEILKEKQFAERIINNLPGILCLIDDAGKFIQWNEQLEIITGYSHEEMAKRTPLDKIADEHKAYVAQRIQLVLENGSADAECDIVSKTGVRTPFYLYGKRILIDGKQCVMGMGIDVSRRKKAEQKLEFTSTQLRALAARLQLAREEERTRIAREIHDVLGQSLTGLKLDLAWLAKKIGGDQPALLEKIRDMTELVDPTIDLVRKICTELRPGVLDDLGLSAAIEWQAEEFSARTGIETKVTAQTGAIPLDGERSTAVFRIFQEALTNIARHSRATQVRVELSGSPQGVELIVRDNGRGITASDCARPESLGVLGMQERAHVFGGEVRITGVPGEGTTVKVSVPASSFQNDRSAR